MVGLQVPYAAPPVGKRRFLAPQPVEAWEGATWYLIKYYGGVVDAFSTEIQVFGTILTAWRLSASSMMPYHGRWSSWITMRIVIRIKMRIRMGYIYSVLSTVHLQITQNGDEDWLRCQARIASTWQLPPLLSKDKSIKMHHCQSWWVGRGQNIYICSAIVKI